MFTSPGIQQHHARDHLRAIAPPAGPSPTLFLLSSLSVELASNNFLKHDGQGFWEHPKIQPIPSPWTLSFSTASHDCKTIVCLAHPWRSQQLTIPPHLGSPLHAENKWIAYYPGHDRRSTCKTKQGTIQQVKEESRNHGTKYYLCLPINGCPNISWTHIMFVGTNCPAPAPLITAATLLRNSSLGLAS